MPLHSKIFVQNLELFIKLEHHTYLNQMGLSNTKNRTLKEIIKAMLINLGLPQKLRDEAILSADHILTKIPHKNKIGSHYELQKGRKPFYKYIKEWDVCQRYKYLDLNK